MRSGSSSGTFTRKSRIRPLALALALVLAHGAAAGARAETEVAALHPLDLATREPDTDVHAVRAAVQSEARHLRADLRDAVSEALTRAELDHGIPALLLVAVIAQESSFDPMARGVRGALGLMQLRPFVARDYARRRGLSWKGEQTLLDPVRNIQIASGYLGELFARFGSVDLALEAYNKGPEYVKRQLRRGESGPTPRFVKSVLGRYERYATRYSGL